MDLLRLYVDEIAKYKKIYSLKEQRHLGQRIKEGDNNALKDLIRGNLLFVVNIAKRYDKYNVALNLFDLINAGNMGLFYAATRFDWKKNNKFLTYAYWWIKRSILLEIAKSSRSTKISIPSFEKAYLYDKTREKLYQKYFREPSISEIAKEMNLKDGVAKFVHNLFEVRLDTDDCIDTSEIDEEEPDHLKIKLIEDALHILSEKQCKIIRLYFGFDGGEEMSYKDIGKILKMSHEGVRLHKNSALKKIQNYLNKKKNLYEY